MAPISGTPSLGRQKAHGLTTSLLNQTIHLRQNNSGAQTDRRRKQGPKVIQRHDRKA